MATAVVEAVTAAAAGGSNVEFIRARSDKREYRRVVLANALEILLISDPDTDKVRLRLRLRLRPPPFACSPIKRPLGYSESVAAHLSSDQFVSGWGWLQH
jgi:hypothetical protein